MSMFLIIDTDPIGMAVHGTRGDGTDLASLPNIVPLELSHLSRLSWELGSRVVSDTESALIGEWRHASNRWRLSGFAVTDNTVILRVRTSVGRERFYGAINGEFRSALPAIETAPSWQRIE